MTTHSVEGIVRVIGETETLKNDFKKRLVVLQQEGDKFENFYPIDFTGDNCRRADALTVGDKVRIEIYINGRKWNDKFFTNLTAAKDMAILEKAPAPAPTDNDEVPF